MRVPRAALAAVTAALTIAVSGCASEVPRTSTFLLGRETAGAFERAFHAHYRMTTGRSDDDLLAARRSLCRKLEPPPAPERPGAGPA